MEEARLQVCTDRVQCTLSVDLHLARGDPLDPRKHNAKNIMNEVKKSVEKTLEMSPSQKRAAYKKAHWQAYTKTHKRVYGTLTKDEYRTIKVRADQENRSVWEQIWQESCHYREQEKLLSQAEAKQLDELYFILRNIGNNINQVAKHSNTFSRLVQDRRILKQLENLESTVDAFIRKKSQ